MNETSTITVNRAELGSALTFATLGLHKRPGLPVLAGIKLTVSCGTLELAAFDYDTAARCKVSGQASGPGEILVNGAELSAAVKSLPKGKAVTADLAFDADSLIIECDGTETVLSSLPIGEYPQLPVMPAESGLVDAQSFARTVTRVAACAGTDDTLPVLLCVRVTSDHGELEMAATDRYRLGVDTLHWTGPDGAAANVPAVMLAKFAKAADKSGKIALHFSDGFAGFSDGTRSLIVHTATGDFPRYRNLMRPASDQDTTVLVDAAKLEAAVSRAGKIGERNSRTGFTVTDAGVTVTAEIDGKTAASQVVPATVDGEPFDTGFNAAYLASVLAGFTGSVRIGLKVKTTVTKRYDGSEETRTSEQPALLTADGDTFTALIMAVRKPS